MCLYGSQDVTYVFQPRNLQFYFISAMLYLGVSHRNIAIFAKALELSVRESIAAPSLGFLERQTAKLFISQL